MTRRTVPFVTLILASVTAAPPLFGQSPEGSTTGDALAVSADRVFGDLGVDGSPGCAVGAVEQGHWVLKRAYGHANLDWGTPITSNTVFYAGSVSKQFTAAAIVLLEQDGKLSLSDPIQTLFPEFDDWPRTLTLRHLIHHTSGVPDLYRVMDKHGLSTWDRFSPDQAVALLANEPLDFEPGERFSYSNGGYLLLSQVVLRASGQSLRAFTDARIFGPLGMLDTHFHDDPMHVVPRRAMSYGPTEDGGFQQTYEGNFALPGAGGLYTSVDDFIRWDENFATGTVGGPEFASIMSQRGVLNSGEQLDYAFAQTHGARGNTRLIDHTGSFMGFKAYYVRFPDEGRSMWAFCNYGPLTPKDLTLQVADSWIQQR